MFGIDCFICYIGGYPPKRLKYGKTAYVHCVSVAAEECPFFKAPIGSQLN